MPDKVYLWDIDAQAARDTELRVVETTFGDGYTQAVSRGINNAAETWTCSTSGDRAEVDAVHAFLLERAGVKPFRLPMLGAGYYRTTGNIALNHIGGYGWTISFTAKRVFI